MDVIKKYSGIGGGAHTPNKLIIHSIYEYFDYNGELLYAPDFITEVGLSAHFYIMPNGEIIKQRKTTLKAWHAKGNNTNSVGIEVVVKGSGTYESFVERIKEDWVTGEQMDSLIELSNGIVEHYDIDKDNVLRHSDISPTRKVDPGSGFDWEYFKSKLI